MVEESSMSARDKQVIKYQLGRAPRGVMAIIKRCSKGFPQVILSSPLLRSTTPFPTIFWLTCPLLNKEVAARESQGLVKHIQQQIAEDKSFREAVLRAQTKYREERAKILRSSSNIPGYAKKVLEEAGVGGINDFSKVKCLHAHFAHYLATGENPIGERVGRLIGNVVCTRDCGEQ